MEVYLFIFYANLFTIMKVIPIKHSRELETYIIYVEAWLHF